MNKTSIILTAVLAAILVVGAFVGGWFAGKGRRPKPSVVIKTDTIIFRDTITKYKPKYITKIESGKDTLYVRDTIRERDSVFVVLPRERKVYSDSNYRAVVTGVRPELEEISVYPKTQIVTTTITQTVTKEPPRISFSVQMGAGAQYDIVHNQFGFGPYIGGGVSVRLGKKKK